MAEQEQVPAVDVDEDEIASNYKPPAEKALDEILTQDAEDESLVKYKQALLGQTGGAREFWPDNPKNVIVKKLTFVTDGRDNIELDLTGDLEELKKKSFKIKEGAKYCLKVTFCVQREIVSGLIYNQKVFKTKIRVDNIKHMVGSYGPQEKEYEFTTPMEDAPSGMLARGTYKVESQFTDDDKKDHLSWKWEFQIAKSWD